MASTDPYQQDYEHAKAGLPPAAPKPPPASFTRSEHLHREPSPAAKRTAEMLASAGGIGMGVLFLVIALVIHAHYATVNGICTTGLGQLGQDFSTSAMMHCSAAADFEGAVGWLVFVGLGAIIVGAVKLAVAASKVSSPITPRPGPEGGQAGPGPGRA